MKTQTKKHTYIYGYAEFVKVLRKNGFYKLSTADWADKKAKCYQHKSQNYFAEIIIHGSGCDLWITGPKLQSSTFPGGKFYSSAQDLQDALTIVL